MLGVMTQPLNQPPWPPQQPQGTPPYGQPYAQPPYSQPPRPPRRRRPSAWWFALGAALLVLTPIVFGVSLFLTLRPLAQQDGVLPADGSPHQVSVPAGEDRALFTDGPSASEGSCQVLDGSGQPLDLRPVQGDFTYHQWQATERFNTGDGDLTLTCTSAASQSNVRVAQLPSTRGFVSGLLVGVLVPLLLGGLGLLCLLITTILFATGRPRHEPSR